MTAKNVVFITLEDETGHSNFVVMPDIFEGTSPGAMEFGARRYVFGATGWTRQRVTAGRPGSRGSNDE